MESLRNALTVAARVAYAIDLEKRNSAEINALLNYTFSGIVQVDREGIIRRVNRISYNLLEHPADTLLGRPISEILPNLNQNVLDNALIGGRRLTPSCWTSTTRRWWSTSPPFWWTARSRAPS